MIFCPNVLRRLFTTRSPLLALLLLAGLGCESSDRISSTTADEGLDAPLSFAPASVSGIPFGSFAQPLSLYGPIYTGGHLNPEKPEYLLSRLATIRAAHGRVVLALVGAPPNYINADGTFNFDLWKGRLDRYTGTDFSSYLADGTIVGNFLIDQPSCSTCWGGQAISQETVEAMAQYSKTLWPDMLTITRSDPTWLKEFPGEYGSLDAGWAQYVMRKGDVNTYLADNVAAAQSKGLGLIVGLNVLNGGLDQENLTASQLKNFGSVLLGSSYPCAFISWKYDAAYFSRTDIKSALELLSRKAKRHARTSCRG
jgi:hypothetical protein